MHSNFFIVSFDHGAGRFKEAAWLIFDGWPGWYYVFQRTLAEIILSLRLIEGKLKN